MNLQQYRQISLAMNAELKAVFEKFGFSTSKLNASLEDGTGIVRLSIQISDKNLKAADGSATTPEAENYKRVVAMFGAHTGLKPEWLNQTFRMGGHEYRLAGMKNTTGKNKMLVQRLSDNSMRVTTEEQVVLCFGRSGIHPAENVGSTTDQGRGAKPLGEVFKDAGDMR